MIALNPEWLGRRGRERVQGFALPDEPADSCGHGLPFSISMRAARRAAGARARRHAAVLLTVRRRMATIFCQLARSASTCRTQWRLLELCHPHSVPPLDLGTGTNAGPVAVPTTRTHRNDGAPSDAVDAQRQGRLLSRQSLAPLIHAAQPISSWMRGQVALSREFR